MKGYGNWSYAPYKPLMTEVGDIYICRVVPGKSDIYFEWLEGQMAPYSIYYRKRGDEKFEISGQTDETQWTITSLAEQTDYEFYVQSGEKKSRVRLAHTGESVGTVVNYLHPDDEAYAFSGRYLCSPSLVRHPEGYLLASMDLFATDHPQNLTLIYRSDDEGETWHYVSELMPCFWGKMFIHNGELYMLAVSTEYGDLLIGKSTDGGKTFSAPVALLRGSNGKNHNDGVHKNPQNILIHNGRIYNTMEWGAWGSPNEHNAMVMSCALTDDLLVPENWSFSEPVSYDPNWQGTVDGPAAAPIEGTLTVSPDGNLFNIMRYNISMEAVPSYGLVLAYQVNTEDPDAPLTYSHSIQMNCNQSKFMIKYDPVSKRYFSVATEVGEGRESARNLLSLMSSEDMENWRTVCHLLDYRGENVFEVGFQYVDFEFDGEDIIYLCRTAINGARNFHDANYSTFHRIENFRKL